MKKFIQVNKEKVLLKKALDNKEINIEKYVSDMKTLNNNMPSIEKQMINEYDDISIALVTSNKNNSVLQKNVKELVNLGENMIPKSYMRISKRFPHLTLQEIIDFEKKVRENGGSIQVHSGYFRLTERVINTDSYEDGNYCHTHKERHAVNITWDCCHSVAVSRTPNYTTVAVFPTDKPHQSEFKFRKCKEHDLFPLRTHTPTPQCCGAIDLINKPPDGQCDFPETFYLKEEDEKKQDISQVQVSDVSEHISNNIKVLENTIEEYSEKIEKLKSLQENLNLLKDI